VILDLELLVGNGRPQGLQQARKAVEDAAVRAGTLHLLPLLLLASLLLLVAAVQPHNPLQAGEA
jgi:cellobiose-specific phosphotransferase system component IIC